MSMTLTMVGMSRGRVEEVAAMEVDDYFEFVSESLCLELDRAWAGVGWLAKAVGIDDNTCYSARSLMSPESLSSRCFSKPWKR
jgi:hypothetical protein